MLSSSLAGYAVLMLPTWLLSNVDAVVCVTCQIQMRQLAGHGDWS